MEEKKRYSRMLDKTKPPTEEEFYEFCAQRKSLLYDCDHFLMSFDNVSKCLRFPYGNNYGWSYKYSRKNKLICEIFAEVEAFTVMIRLSNQQIDSIYGLVTAQTQELIDNKYPCSDGGWLHYRILNQDDLMDIKKLIQIKLVHNK
ncbi:MAG: DUF3788 domain-containing protein [Anaerorhabdus sp.]